MIDHDGLYKAVIGEFFLDFLRLFFPQLAERIDPASVKEKEQELINDLPGSQTLRADIVREVQFKGQSSLILILIEPQSYDDKRFGERLYRYFTRLYEKYGLPIIPIAVLSYASPKAVAPRSFSIAIEDFTALTFNYLVVQLNRLHWQDYAERQNPVAAAFMAQMQVGKKERAKAKLAALTQVVDLSLNPAQRQLLSAFVDVYITLDVQQQSEFEQGVNRLNRGKQEVVMQLVTSWMREGIAQGRIEGKFELVSKQLARRFGPLTDEEESRLKTLNVNQVETLGEDFLDFKDRTELTAWLDAHPSVPSK